jgi:hypothetical protein
MAGSTMAAEIKKMQAPTTIMICLTMLLRQYSS